jgi:hypothetical protein
MKLQAGVGTIDVTQPDVLAEVFSRENVTFTLKRMASTRDKDNLIAHPLRSAVLIEFEEDLSEMISRLVIAGLWSPAASYVCFAHKRSGNYRELVFPCLIDSVVGRRAIDVLEPGITTDDNGRVFCGRSHASTTRQRGDYEDWFQTWLDFSSSIATAAKGERLAYVYDTDVADFFPSIDRPRAKQFLAQRTGAHASLIELVFYCLEAWLPRFNYMAMTGLPIEPNDISRLVAHNYLKIVDSDFPDTDRSRYVRYVDDSAIFVPDLKTAEDVKRRHHMSLRAIGLNPNAAKSEIMTVEEYEQRRHREVNLDIDRVFKSKDEKEFETLVTTWYDLREKTENWDRVTKRLYRTARLRRWDVMNRFVVEDLQKAPQLTSTVVEYLLQLENADEYLDDVLRLWTREEGNAERLIQVARFVCDASFSSDASKRIADFAVGRVIGEDDRQGAGYARALLLLAVHKHGNREHREKIVAWASVDNLKDEQLRLHFLYVFVCRKELDEKLRSALVPLISSDIDLLLRLCAQALDGKVKRARKILNRYVRVRPNCRTIEARALPLLFALAKSRNADVQAWFEWILRPGTESWRPVRDLVVRSMLETLHREMVS